MTRLPLFALLFAEDGPADEGDAAKDLVEQRRQGEDGHGEDGVHRHGGQLGVHLHHVAEAGDHEVVDDVEAEAAAGHIGRERGGSVELGAEPADQAKDGQPAVCAVQRAAQVLRSRVVLAEAGGDENAACRNRCRQCGHPILTQKILHRVVAEDEVAHQERHEVEQRLVEVVEAVGAIGARIMDEQLPGGPVDDAKKQHCQDEGDDAASRAGGAAFLRTPEDAAAPVVEASPAVERTDEEKQQREEPEVLDEPKRADAAETPCEVLDQAGGAFGKDLRTTRVGGDCSIEVAGHPLEDEQADGGRHQELAGSG